MRSHFIFTLSVLAGIGLLAGTTLVKADVPPGTLTVQADRPGVKISPMLYGLMTEEINHAYDGGLYGELIQNRSFMFDVNNPIDWSLVQGAGSSGAIALENTQPINSTLTRSLKLTIAKTAGGRVGVANDGFWGIPVKPNTVYHASLYAKASRSFYGSLVLDIESNDGSHVFAKAQTGTLSTDWQKYSVTLTTGNTGLSKSNRFVVSSKTPGTVYLDQVSLFPPTFHGRPNGNRIDLMQKMDAMNASFLRLPGGNYLEGNAISERFDWKKTIHRVDERPGHQGPWRYRSTDGLGLLEYLEWCEDLNVQPLLAVYAGYSLPPKNEVIPAGQALQPYVQDALDEIEYATGNLTTPWGAQRAADGHPAPFKIQYVEIGNEDWFDPSGSYNGRFAQFYDAIKGKYPNLKLIATMSEHSRPAELNDEHFYRTADQMAGDANHYDNYSRTGPSVFVGEWASVEGSPTPTMKAALGDAVWLTGLERNSDIVLMSCYAPMLVNINPGASQWGTNLIGYDALTSFASPSYYVQKMFGNNRGDTVLPVTVIPQAFPAAPLPPTTGGIGAGTWLTQAAFKDVNVTHDGQSIYHKDFSTGDDDWKTSGGTWSTDGNALMETTTIENCRATAGSPDWSDYSYSLKAQKTGGNEGFLIMVHVKDDDNYIWWNIGGWGNTRTALERSYHGVKSQLGASTPMSIENGRWYDIRIDVTGHHIRCFLDGQLVTEADDLLSPPPGPIISTASRDLATGDIILKVVNYQERPQTLTVGLNGVNTVAPAALLEQITGEPDDVNTIDSPKKIVPVSTTIQGVGKTFVHSFPGYSVSVIRVKTGQ